MSAEDKLSKGALILLTITLLGGAFVAAFETYGTLTAMPVAARELGHIELFAWTFTVFVLAQVMAIVFAGGLADRRGPAVILMGGSVLFLIGLVAAGFADSMAWLLVTRFIQGLGAGALGLSLMVVVPLAYGGAMRAKMMSAFSFMWVLPSFVGPPISAWITLHFGWHWVFWGIAPILAVIMVIGLVPLFALQRLYLPPESFAKGVPGWAAVATALGAGALQYAGQRLDLVAIAIALTGLIALGISLPRLMPPGFTRLGAGLPAVMAVRAAMAGGFFAGESFLTLTLTEIYAFSLDTAGLFLALGSTGWTIGSIIQASRRVRLRRDQIIWWGAVICLVGQGVIVPAVAFSWSWLIVAIGYTVAGLGMGLAVPGASLAVMQLSEPQYLGRNTSSVQVADGIGNSLVTGLGGVIFAGLHTRYPAETTYTFVYLICAAAIALGLLASGRIGPVANEAAD